MGFLGSDWSFREVLSNPFLLLVEKPEPKPLDGNPLSQPPNDPGDAWREYVATNLLNMLESQPEYNSGDWYGALMNWAREHATERIPPNPIHRLPE